MRNRGRSRRRERGRVAGRRVAMAAALAAVGLLLFGALLLRDPRPRIEARRSEIVAATAEPAPAQAARHAPEQAAVLELERPARPHRVELVHLRTAGGLEVELAIKRPAAADSACSAAELRPAVILLGGHRTGRNAVHLIDDTRGTIVAALSYPFAGNHRVKGPAIAAEVPGIRRAIFDTPAAIIVAVDHLATQPCVDPARIEAVGVSLGAPFVIIAAALDERIARVWAVHGAGGIYEPLELNLRRQLGTRIGSIPLASLAALLLAGEQLAPERWVHEIAPRPFVMINARDDERIPRASVERLYESARQPKELIWMSGGHVRSEAEVVRPLIDLILARITGQGVSDSVEGQAEPGSGSGRRAVP